MIKQWRAKKRIQRTCDHDWHVIRKYKKRYTRSMAYDYREYCEIYCPRCEKIRLKVPQQEVDRAVEIRHIRRLHERVEKEGFRKGDDITWND